MVQVNLHILAVLPEPSPLSHSMGFDDGQTINLLIGILSHWIIVHECLMYDFKCVISTTITIGSNKC